MLTSIVETRRPVSCKSLSSSSGVPKRTPVLCALSTPLTDRVGVVREVAFGASWARPFAKVETRPELIRPSSLQRSDSSLKCCHLLEKGH